jgi:hypothetical protein
LNPSVVTCGRCGASNQKGADFCDECGAFLAAYQAPAGATETVPALRQPAESTPVSEITYTPPSPPSPPSTTIVVDEPPEPEIALENGPVEEIPASEAQIDADEFISDPVELEVVEPLASAPTPQPQPTPEPPPRPKPYAYTPPPSPPPTVKPDSEAPIPAIYRAVFGKYAEIAFPAERLPGTGRSSPSPQTFILIGIAALLGVCVAAIVASSNGAIFLLIGGPIAISLIAIGVLILVGRYPTGRP